MFVVKKSEQPDFKFQLEGRKKVYSTPLLMNLPVSKIRRVREFVKSGASGEEATFGFLDFMGDIFGNDLIDSMKIEEVEYLYTAWKEASGITDDEEALGE